MADMRTYLVSLGAGLLVGIVYSLLNVRSPAPPVVALVGLLGILVGEQIIPLARHMLEGSQLAAAWRQSNCTPHIFGLLPGGQQQPTRPEINSKVPLHSTRIDRGFSMMGNHYLIRILLLASFLTAASSALARNPARSLAPQVGLGAQYDTTHVYVAPDEVDKFATSFLATFGGTSTKQVVATVTPTPSSTTSQLLQTPVGTVSLFGFKTPIPYPFAAERSGYLVADMDEAIRLAKACGADVLVSSFPDPIGRDAVIQWPGGINTQLYWHTRKPSYAAFEAIPENRVYVSPQRAEALTRSFLCFSRGRVVSDDPRAPGIELGRPNDTYRRIRIESVFGKMTVFVTDGHLPYPYGRELTGYQVADLKDTLSKASASGATVLVEPFTSQRKESAMVQFPGGYVAEIHASAK